MRFFSFRSLTAPSNKPRSRRVFCSKIKFFKAVFPRLSGPSEIFVFCSKIFVFKNASDVPSSRPPWRRATRRVEWEREAFRSVARLRRFFRPFPDAPSDQGVSNVRNARRRRLSDRFKLARLRLSKAVGGAGTAAVFRQRDDFFSLDARLRRAGAFVRSDGIRADFLARRRRFGRPLRGRERLFSRGARSRRTLDPGPDQRLEGGRRLDFRFFPFGRSADVSRAFRRFFDRRRKLFRSRRKPGEIFVSIIISKFGDSIARRGADFNGVGGDLHQKNRFGGGPDDGVFPLVGDRRRFFDAFPRRRGVPFGNLAAFRLVDAVRSSLANFATSASLPFFPPRRARTRRDGALRRRNATFDEFRLRTARRRARVGAFSTLGASERPSRLAAFSRTRHRQKTFRRDDNRPRRKLRRSFRLKRRPFAEKKAAAARTFERRPRLVKPSTKNPSPVGGFPLFPFFPFYINKRQKRRAPGRSIERQPDLGAGNGREKRFRVARI